MPVCPERLKKILSAGDLKAVCRLFKGATEPERQAVAPIVSDWCKRLHLNWKAQFDRKAEAEVKRTGPTPNWYQAMPAASAAALACANISEIKSLGTQANVPPEAAEEILSERRPPWLDEYVELLSGGELRAWGANWKTVRALVRAGLCQPPKHDNYVLDALNGIWPAYEANKTPPKLVDLLLQERDWLEQDFWRLFELDGNGEVSLANSDKYSKSAYQTWSDALVELSRRQILSRERLLDASLAALSRDFIQFRAGWFSRFHEALAPTPAERVERVKHYLLLLGSNIPPTVAFALNAIVIVHKVKPLPAAELVGALQPALSARGKAVVKTAIQLLRNAAGRDPLAGLEVCLAVMPALLNEAADVQKAVFDLLEAHAQPGDPALASKLEEYQGAVVPSLKNRLKPWLNGKDSRAAQPSKSETTVAGKPVLSRINPHRAIEPLRNLEDLIHLAGVVLEDPASPDEIERVLDGVSRLCDQRPKDFQDRSGPLRKRALQKRDGRQGDYVSRPVLERQLAMFLLTWIDGKDAFTETPEQVSCGQNQYAFLFRRLEVLGHRVASQQALPLLSAPTHAGGWIEPCALAERWLQWQKAGLKLDLEEQVLALLRLSPEGREKAIILAKKLSGEVGEALRFALGDKVTMGKTPALWLAAWRSRQPYGDLPEFESKYPRLGPDAGTGAQYTWEVRAERNKFLDRKWTSLKLKLQTKPACPKALSIAFLPVLFHGPIETSEEGKKELIRWAAQLWPANREAMFARASTRLEIAVDYADAMDRELCAYVEPLVDWHTELRPMACLSLALSLAAEENSLRGHAQDGLIAAISEGRLDVDLLGSTMARLLETGINRFMRWAKALGEVARVSPLHANAVINLIAKVLGGDPAKAPRNLSALLEVLFELLCETNQRLDDKRTREYLSGLSMGGKTAKLVKQVLAI